MSYETLNPTGSKERLDDDGGWVYVDVRTVEEFEAGHVPGAYNIPFLFRGEMGMEPNDGFVAAVKNAFAAEARLVVGCAAGGRSMHACELLTQEGFANLVNMHGGFSGARDPLGTVTEPGWQACGYDVTTEALPEQVWEALKGA